jgi:signal peptidase I
MIGTFVKDGELVVPSGNYFVLGDNRDDSDDSRFWGLVPRENVLGKPVLVYDSHESSPVPGESDTPTRLNERWSRIFKLP